MIISDELCFYNGSFEITETTTVSFKNLGFCFGLRLHLFFLWNCFLCPKLFSPDSLMAFYRRSVCVLQLVYDWQCM